LKVSFLVFSVAGEKGNTWHIANLIKMALEQREHSVDLTD